MCINFTAYRLNNSNCDHMQVVLTSEYTDAWQPTLSELPNVSVVSYNTSGCGEMELRQQIRVAQRAMGLSGYVTSLVCPSTLSCCCKTQNCIWRFRYTVTIAPTRRW